MSTISVPLSPEQEQSLNGLVASGYGSNKADVIRRALKKASEDEAVRVVIEAQMEIADGKGLTGDLRELMRAIN